MKEGKLFSSVSEIVLLCVVLILGAALIFSAVIIKDKNAEISAAQQEIEKGEKELKEEKEKYTEATSKLAETEKQKEEISSKLQTAEEEKKKLQQENSSLKVEIELLKAEKELAGLISTSPQSPTPSGSKICYLTFDDGPSNNTLEILKVLKKFNIKATFFVTESANFSYVKNINDEGHTVGLHCSSHVYSKIYASTDAYFADLNRISSRVESITGKKSTVIRFPGGSSNSYRGMMQKLTKMVKAKGYSYFDWNVDSGDADGNTMSYTYIRNRVLQGANGKNDICVLMHDSSAKTTTVQALPHIIAGLHSMGYRFEALKPETFGFQHVK